MTDLTISELKSLCTQNFRMRKALEKIAKWHGEFPHTFDGDGDTCSFAYSYGIRGEIEYMRKVAKEALKR